MQFTCVELEGAPYQPRDVLKIDDFWIIPACKEAAAYEERSLKLFIVFHENEHWRAKVESFMFYYQYLFLNSTVYRLASPMQDWSNFIEEGEDIGVIIKKIQKKYGTGGGLAIDFTKIEQFYSGIEGFIDFKSLYHRFIIRYLNDRRIKDSIDLFLYTIGSESRFYKNIFLKFAQLQIIFESLIGQPSKETRAGCIQDRNTLEWKSYIAGELSKRGVTDVQVINLIVNIKTILNKAARTPYIHSAKQLNTWRMTLEELKNRTDFNISSYTTNFIEIIKLHTDKWAAIDWENVYLQYQKIVKGLIYLSLFEDTDSSTN